MKKYIKYALLVIIALSSMGLGIQQVVFQDQVPPAEGWNPSLATDTNLVAWYEFDADALSTDSSGNGNDLDTCNNCSNNTTQFMRGNCSARLPSSSSSYGRIMQTNLPSDWPGHTGANDVVSVVFWVYVHSTASDSNTKFVSMYNPGSNYRSWEVNLDFSTTPDEWGIMAGYNSGVDYENKYTNEPGNAGTGRWFFVAMVENGDADTYFMAVYDYYTAAWLDFDSGTGGQQNWGPSSYTNNVFSLTAADFYINQRSGGGNSGDYSYDDLMIFKDALTWTEIQAIRVGTY